MSDVGAGAEPPDPTHSPEPRREVPDWEYKTAYVHSLQVRIPAQLHLRLEAWAARQGKPLGELVTEQLEKAVSRRGA